MKKFAFLLLFGFSLACQGAVIMVANTGTDANSDGRDDLFKYNGSGAWIVNSVISPDTGSSWLSSPTSNWIGPVQNQVDGTSVAAGTYEYTFSFDSSGYLLNTLVLDGLWAIDGRGLDILINGKSTGTAVTGPTSGAIAGAYTEFTSFLLGNGSCSGGCFVNGMNTVTFRISNGAWESGMAVEMEVLGSAVPEPGTGLLLSLGLGAGALALRRRRTA